ncbi:hypothetical protein II906_01015 [bacterium]|nr:hypothetical protein [bacterium]
MLKKINDEKIFKFIINNLRKEDLLELKASKGSDWFNETLKAIKTPNAIVMFIKTETGRSLPVAVGGFEPYGNEQEKMAVVWLLTTKFVSNYKYIFWKELKSFFCQEKSKYLILFNFIYKSNFQAKRWLRLLGFKFDNPHPQNMKVPEDFEFFYKVIKRKEI